MLYQYNDQQGIIFLLSDMDDSNGDFEMVDKVSNQSDTSSTSMLTNIPPPSALPTFITAPAPPNANSE
ncbi:hypothetical protein Avbf_07232 [Armadillidium vulgare]|nr:hypothetical protein Avbf_07232 [Armadillidium vulgare]